MYSLRALLIVCAVIAAACSIYFYTDRPTPLYGFAVFGNEGSVDAGLKPAGSLQPKKAQFIAIGRDVFFDRNNDGVAQPSEKFQPSNNQFNLPLPDGDARHQNRAPRYRLASAVVGIHPDTVSEDLPQHIVLNVNVHSPGQPDEPEFRQAGKITVYPEPHNTGWAHFDGPLSFQFLDDNTTLAATGGPGVELRVAITTPQEAGRNLATIVPGTLVPTATVEFPSDSPGKPIVKRYDMKQFC